MNMMDTKTHLASLWTEEQYSHRVRLMFPRISEPDKEHSATSPVFAFVGLVWYWYCEKCKKTWPYGHNDKILMERTPCGFVDGGAGI